MLPAIARGSTPRIVIRVRAGVSDAGPLLVSIRSRAGTETYSGERLSVTPDGGGVLVALTLDQEETLAYEAGEVLQVQVKARGGDGRVLVSVAALVRVREVLDEQVV